MKINLFMKRKRVYKQYTRTRYQPVRKAKIISSQLHYSSINIEQHYNKQLSILLSNACFTQNSGDLEYIKDNMQLNVSQIKVPYDSGLHSLWYNKYFYDYVIFTIHYKFSENNNHVSIVIIDTTKKIIEWFDTWDTSDHIFNPLIEKLKKYLPHYEIFKVNKKDIQEDDDDYYCQTWIYYYVWQRLYKKKDSESIMNKILSKNIKSRTDLIRKFHYKIIL